MEVWRWYKSDLAGILARVFSAIGHLGCTPAGSLVGEIHPFHKSGDRADQCNYRPICLLNSDYRLLAKILAARLGPLLAHCIGPEQTAFLPGRRIGDNILLRQLLPAALRLNIGAGGSQPSAAVMALLDFVKAYDTISRDFLLQVMETVGAGEGLLSWVRSLLCNTQAAVCINGHLSDRVDFRAGVRQGCPLAPALYLFIAWALWCWLKECPVVGVPLLAGDAVMGDQYADDTMALLQSLTPPDVALFLTHMETFAKASGQRLNLRKSALVPIGDTAQLGPLPAEVAGLRVVLAAASLGVTFSNEPQTEPPGGWQAPLDRTTAALGLIAKLPLSVFGRATAAFSYALSSLLFYAEHNGLPPDILQQLQRATYNLVDRGLPPPPPGGTYPRSPLAGIPSRLLVGRPSEGGFGLIPLEAHLHARAAANARRFIAWSADSPSSLAPKNQRFLHQLPPTSLSIEDRLLQNVPPARPAWIDLAEALLLRAFPSTHPSLALIAAAQFPNVDLPHPLLRMAAGLAALGPLHKIQETAQPPAHWCLALPLWHNPLIHLSNETDAHSALPNIRTVGDALHLQPQLVSLQGILSRIQDPTNIVAAVVRADVQRRLSLLATVLSAVPSEWLMQSSSPSPPPSNAPISLLLGSLGWPASSQRPSVPLLQHAEDKITFSVRSATTLQTSDALSAQHRSRRQYVEAAFSVTSCCHTGPL